MDEDELNEEDLVLPDRFFVKYDPRAKFICRFVDTLFHPSYTGACILDASDETKAVLSQTEIYEQAALFLAGLRLFEPVRPYPVLLTVPPGPRPHVQFYEDFMEPLGFVLTPRELPAATLQELAAMSSVNGPPWWLVWKTEEDVRFGVPEIMRGRVGGVFLDRPLWEDREAFQAARSLVSLSAHHEVFPLAIWWGEDGKNYWAEPTLGVGAWGLDPRAYEEEERLARLGFSFGVSTSFMDAKEALDVDPGPFD
jgi:hypothetical protein